MKTRILLYVFALGLCTLAVGILAPASVVGRNALAVDTVANSDVAYVAQHLVERSVFPYDLVGYSVITIIFWLGPILRMQKSK